MHILGPTYFGARQVGLKTKKKINYARRHGRHQAANAAAATPGSSLASRSGPTRRRWLIAEAYTGLQTRRHRWPGQSAAERAEHEVQRGHVADRADVASRRLRPPGHEHQGLERHDCRTKQKSFQAAVDKAIEWSTSEHLKQEAELVETFKKQGLEVYTPDINAFREYRAEGLSRRRSWPRLAAKECSSKINALKV